MENRQSLIPVNSRRAEETILLTGAHGFGVSAALIAALGAVGVCVINLEDDREIETRRHNRELLGRLDILDMIIGNGPRGSRRPDALPPVRRREIQFNDTPKPMSKRSARRLRGKAEA